MHPNYDCYYCRSERYNKDNSKKYQLVIMDVEGKTYLSGRIYNSFEEVHEAMIELRVLYAKNEVSHHVGYMEVR